MKNNSIIICFNTILAVLCISIPIVLTVLFHEEAGCTSPVDAWLSSAALAVTYMMTLAMCVGIILIDCNVYDKLESFSKKLKRSKGYHNHGYGDLDLVVGLFRDKEYPYTHYQYLASQTWYAYERHIEYMEHKEMLYQYIGSQRALIKELYPAKGTMADMLLWNLYGMTKVFGHLVAELDVQSGNDIPVFKAKGFGPKYYDPKVGDIVSLRNKDFMVIMLSYDAEMEDNILWLKELESVPMEFHK